MTMTVIASIWYTLTANQSDRQAAGGSWTINSTRGVIINNSEEICKSENFKLDQYIMHKN
jgi:hypothetical protein